MTGPAQSQLQEKSCVRCGAAFGCGALATDEKCWCAALPHISPSKDATDCLCRACLEKEVARHG